jgi:hypothetical protein
MPSNVYSEMTLAKIKHIPISARDDNFHWAKIWKYV